MWCDGVDIADRLYIMDIMDIYIIGTIKNKNYLKFNKNRGWKMALFRRSFLVASIGIIETSGGYISIFWGGSSVENLPELSNFHTFPHFNYLQKYPFLHVLVLHLMFFLLQPIFQIFVFTPINISSNIHFTLEIVHLQQNNHQNHINLSLSC